RWRLSQRSNDGSRIRIQLKSDNLAVQYSCLLQSNSFVIYYHMMWVAANMECQI
ncbi:MAG: hypothetical protein ACI8SJ_002760, partial [Shewanella sp.]